MRVINNRSIIIFEGSFYHSTELIRLRARLLPRNDIYIQPRPGPLLFPRWLHVLRTDHGPYLPLVRPSDIYSRAKHRVGPIFRGWPVSVVRIIRLHSEGAELFSSFNVVENFRFNLCPYVTDSQSAEVSNGVQLIVVWENFATRENAENIFPNTSLRRCKLFPPRQLREFFRESVGIILQHK